MFELGKSQPVLCALIYRPPKYNKHFIRDFTELLSEIMPKYDRILIVGDMNIHVCCPTNLLAKDFLKLIDSFNLTQFVSGPTQNHGHTLDLVLSCSLPILNIEIKKAVFSDHAPILFDVSLPYNTAKQCAPPCLCRMIKPATAAQFSETFSNVIETIGPSAFLCTDELISCFSSTCINIIDKIAPLKPRLSKPNPQPWINDLTRAARQKFRKAEHQWKKHKLQVFYDILKDCWRNYQRTVKNVKAKYLSDVIDKNGHKPHVLFRTINSVLYTP